MVETAADAFRGILKGDEVVVEFGQASVPGEGGERTVNLAVRIAMPVATARRLMLALDEVNQMLPKKALSAADPRRGETPVNAPADPASEKAALLLRLVADLGIPYQYERSFRMSAGSLLANRYLLSVNRGDVPVDPRARVLEMCAALGMPPEARTLAEEQFAIAHCVHFGFESDARSIVYKLYLERAVPPDEVARARAVHEPVLLHLAFKWDVVKQTHVVTRYLWYPSLSVEEIDGRLTAVYRRIEPSPSLDIARAVLRLAAGRTPAERLQYLEVHEDDNARWSFDLNLYDARLHLRDIQAPLQRMREHFGVRPGQFQALYDQIKTRTLGHVAGGVHRTGDDFFNIYYGVAGFPQFAERFQ